MSEISKTDLSLKDGTVKFNYINFLNGNLLHEVNIDVFTNAQTVYSKTFGIVVSWDVCSVQYCYESGNNPHDWTKDNFGATAQVGMVSPYVVNELIEPFKTQLSTGGSCSNIYIPQITTGLTYYQDSSLEWIWLYNGSDYFYKKNKQVYFGSPKTEFYCITDSFGNNNSTLSGGNFYNLNVVIMEIAEEMRRNNNINFTVGGAIKAYNFTDNTYRVYLCSTHTANIKKHQADFTIFLASMLYQNPTVTDDIRHLNRDLGANNAIVKQFKNN